MAENFCFRPSIITEIIEVIVFVTQFAPQMSFNSCDTVHCIWFVWCDTLRFC